MRHQNGIHFSNVLLTGNILLAQIDFHGLADYGVKTLMGGAIWLAYKLTADYIDRNRKKKSDDQQHG